MQEDCIDFIEAISERIPPLQEPCTPEDPVPGAPTVENGKNSFENLRDVSLSPQKPTLSIADEYTKFLAFDISEEEEPNPLLFFGGVNIDSICPSSHGLLG